MKKAKISRLLTATAVLLVTGCATSRIIELPNAAPIPFMGPKVSVGAPFIIDETEKVMGHGVYGFSGIDVLPGGMLVVSYSADVDTGSLPNYYAISTNQFHTWQRKVSYDQIQIPVDKWGKISYPDGRRIGYGWVWSQIDYQGNCNRSGVYRFDESGSYLGGDYAFARGGRIGEPNGNVHVARRGVLTPDHKILQVAHGNLIYKEQLGKSGMGYCSVLMISTNRGSVYEFHSFVGLPRDVRSRESNEGACEPAITMLDNGELLCIMRTGLGDGVRSAPMLEARSKNMGDTWRCRTSSLRGVAPKLLKMSNGVLVCGYGRPGNNLSFSTNEGRFWSKTVKLSPGHQLTTGYLDMIEISPGRLFITYDMRDYKEGFFSKAPRKPARNVLMGVFVDVEP